MSLFCKLIEERNFHNAWAKAIQGVLCCGADLVIGGEEERKPIKDSCMLISLEGKAIKQVENRELHPQFPTKKAHLDKYCEEYTRDYVGRYLEKPLNERFAYLYFERLTLYSEYKKSNTVVDQILSLREELSDKKKLSITSNRDQAITWQVGPDNETSSPPCLQRIQIRYIPESKVDVHLTWRSRDLFNAWQSNIIAIIDMLNREVIKPNNCKIARIIDYNDSLHIYKADIEQAKKVKLIPISPQEI
ncbi:MAG: hypothetical protein DRN17_07025 [Thermoplasmata archaeon]|nr:MAG: hypothetical protein DRN17_07025 [Thermoplasmata archaeon]